MDGITRRIKSKVHIGPNQSQELTASSLLGAIQNLGETLKNLQPERVAHTLAFPMPAYGRMIWRVWQPVVGGFGIPLELIPGGSAKLFEPVPKEELMKYMEGAVVDHTEAFRLSLWLD